MSLAKYRVIDLTLITIVGVVSEVIGCYLINYFMVSVIPVFVASFVICYMAIMRWGIWGIIEIPIMALATFVSVKYVIYFTELAEGSSQLGENYLSILCFDAVNLLWLVFRPKKDGNLILNSAPKRIGVLILMYVVGSLLCATVLTIDGINFFVSVLRLLGEQLLALFITCFVIEILHKFNAIYDVKQQLLNRKKEILEEKQFESDYYNQIKKKE